MTMTGERTLLCVRGGERTVLPGPPKNECVSTRSAEATLLLADLGTAHNRRTARLVLALRRRARKRTSL